MPEGSSAPRIAIVDLGMGNLRSVLRAAQDAVAASEGHGEVFTTREPGEILASERIIVPGQGAFRDASAALAGPLGEALRMVLARGTPFLGICLGLQILFERSEEAPGAPGLGWLKGEVLRIAPSHETRVPHMGWNMVEPSKRANSGRLSTALEPATWFYFVHSFHVVPADPSIIAATTRHGPHQLVAAIELGSLWATQFHPEKSDLAGQRLLQRFLSL